MSEHKKDDLISMVAIRDSVAVAVSANVSKNVVSS